MSHEGGWAFVERPDALVWFHDTASELPVVILLHGLAGHALEWAGTIEALASRFRVVSIEQRGHGSSTRRPDDVSREAYVADVVAVIEELETDDVFLIGHSLGAHTAMLVAARHPRLVGRLVMLEGGLGGEGPESVDAVHEWLAGWPAPFIDSDDFVQFFGGNPVVGRAWAEGLEERDDGLWPQWDADTLTAALAPVAEREYVEEWAAVTAPTLLVRGENGMIPGDQFDRMLMARPETRLVTVPHAGHDVHLEQPTAWLAALEEFLVG
ncbi:MULTISPECIES: alpha/beta fold hydrolase [unclassified Nocardioides]|uniref:alpha/beta fold hydrolase n=1 Tax=unclassified Nocardioides TaxID=2615069 RepID=UPI0006F2A65F|nr:MULTISPECIES: alpha/beta hydrolase [unclassified Nocardioides]KQY64660.1 hypothetical protein ASD30_07085 [Nocardioides sp. Root140]KRF12563.1 hypothetical protein ASH02_13440 [Nocardioides sp. Soil796]